MGLWNHSVKTAIACLALTGLVLAGCQQQREKAGDARETGSAGKAKPASEAVIATANGGPITVENVRQYQYIHIFNPMIDIPTLPVAPLAIDEKTSGVLEVAKKIAAFDAAAAAQKKEASAEQIQHYNQLIEQAMQQLMPKYLVIKHVDDKLDPISTEQSTKFYNDHKQEYRIPFMFRMRQLILTTYEPYTVTAGDLASEGNPNPLESIAERVSGSKDKASLIRADMPGRPLRREENKDFKPLVEGEKLLAPMNEEKNEEVHQKLLGILAEMKNGKKFEDLARQHSEAGIGGDVSEWMPTGTLVPQILPEIEEAAKATKIGEVSPPFRTRHGWQAIQIVEKQEDGYTPIETIRSSIVQRMQEKQRKQFTDEMYASLMSQPGIKIHYELFTTSDTSKIKPDTTVAEIDTGTTTPTRVRWSGFEQKWQRTHATRPEGIREALQGESEFVQKAIDMWAKDQLGDSNSEFSRLMAQYRQCAQGILWIVDQATKQARAQVTDEEIRKYYEEHKQETDGPETVKIMFLEKRLGGEEQKLSGILRKSALDRQLQYVGEDIANCKTAEDFRSTANIGRVLIEGPNPLAGQSGEARVDALPSPLKDKIAGVPVGKWTEPFLMDDQSAVSVLIEDRTPAGIKPIEKVSDQIRSALTRTRIVSNAKQLEQDYLKKSGFQSQLAGR